MINGEEEFSTFIKIKVLLKNRWRLNAKSSLKRLKITVFKQNQVNFDLPSWLKNCC